MSDTARLIEQLRMAAAQSRAANDDGHWVTLYDHAAAALERAEARLKEVEADLSAALSEMNPHDEAAFWARRRAPSGGTE